MKIAMIGYGYWGKKMLPILLNFKRQLVIKAIAICDRNYEKTTNLYSQYPDINIYKDYLQLINNEHIDIAFIFTKTDSHYIIAKECIENNIHVFIEKPFVKNIYEAANLIKLAKINNVLIMVGYRFLYSPYIKWLKQNIFENLEKQKINCSICWKKWGIHQAGGVHWDLASHYIAVFNYLAQSKPKIIDVVPLSTNSMGDVEDILIFLKVDPKIFCKIDVSWNHPYDYKEIIVNTKNKIITINPLLNQSLSVHRIEKCTKNCNQYDFYQNSYLALEKQYTNTEMNDLQTIETEINDFINKIISNDQNHMANQIAIETTELLAEIDKIIDSKNEVNPSDSTKFKK